MFSQSIVVGQKGVYRDGTFEATDRGDCRQFGAADV